VGVAWRCALLSTCLVLYSVSYEWLTTLVQVWNACHEYCAKHYEVHVAKVAGALYVVMKLIALSCLLAFSN